MDAASAYPRSLSGERHDFAEFFARNNPPIECTFNEAETGAYKLDV